MEEQTALSPYSAEAIRQFKEEREGGRKKRVREVCACGHSMNYHTEMVDGSIMCKPAQIPCNCKNAKPVLEAENLRLFLHSTNGVGNLHALGRGIVSSLTRGVSFRWLNGGLCQSCGAEESELWPISLNDQAKPLEKSGPINVVVCQGCYVEKFLPRS
jgi:hypothetical protein